MQKTEATISINSTTYPYDNSKITGYINNYITTANILLYHADGLTHLELPNLTKITEGLNCPKLSSLELPKLTSIGDSKVRPDGTHLPSNDNSLRSIEIPLGTSNTIVSSNDNTDNVLTESDPCNFIFAKFMACSLSISDNISIEPTSFSSYTRVIVNTFEFKATTDITESDFETAIKPYFVQSKLTDPVLYVVSNSMVSLYKGLVRSNDIVLAIEDSPFADGKTIVNNNMKTAYNKYANTDGIHLVYDVDANIWSYQDPSSYSLDGKKVFTFSSKLTKEKGYTIPTKKI